jgi:hypothetical protein
LTTASDGKNYNLLFYSLDLVFSGTKCLVE